MPSTARNLADLLAAGAKSILSGLMDAGKFGQRALHALRRDFPDALKTSLQALQRRTKTDRRQAQRELAAATKGISGVERVSRPYATTREYFYDTETPYRTIDSGEDLVYDLRVTSHVPLTQAQVEERAQAQVQRILVESADTPGGNRFDTERALAGDTRLVRITH